jgi:hypothetical protein
VTPDILATLTDCDNIVCFKDSSGDTRRFIDLRNTVGDRFVLFAGLDDVVVESIAVGAEGWISGMSNAFPREGETLFRLARQQRYEEAMALYRWFMPLLHLDARPDLVQCIKLCEELLGRGSAVTRPPRLALEGETRQQVVAIVEQALATRPAAAGRRPLNPGVSMNASQTMAGRQFIAGRRVASGEATLLSLRAVDGEATGHRFYPASREEPPRPRKPRSRRLPFIHKPRRSSGALSQRHCR